jgi:hypothetical protein
VAAQQCLAASTAQQQAGEAGPSSSLISKASCTHADAETSAMHLKMPVHLPSVAADIVSCQRTAVGKISFYMLIKHHLATAVVIIAPVALEQHGLQHRNNAALAATLFLLPVSSLCCSLSA